LIAEHHTALDTRISDGSNGFDDDVLQFCAAAYGFEVRQNGTDTTMQAGLATEKLSFRKIFTAAFLFFSLQSPQETVD
jgi:hypothetical protein